MRALLTRLGLRGGTALGLIVLVLAVVALARLAGGAESPTYLPAPQTTITVNPSAGDDSVAGPAPTRFVDDTAVVAAAKAFTTAWLRRDLDAEAWLAGLSDHATESLLDTLAGVDPSGVPATRMLAQPSVIRRTSLFAEVSVRIDTGTLRLALIKEGNRWLVNGVDWDRL
ncbi:MAG TPA: hypothetical protein VF163_21675 [Micromonosporaceae bacterium]